MIILKIKLIIITLKVKYLTFKRNILLKKYQKKIR